MNSFQVLVIEDPTEEGRAADTKREYSEADRDSPVTHHLSFRKVQKSIGH
jgi:hypothetical protein